MVGARRCKPIYAHLDMIHLRGERFWLGKPVDHPEISRQGETLEELGENLRDAWQEMALEGVPSGYQIRDIAL